MPNNALNSVDEHLANNSIIKDWVGEQKQVFNWRFNLCVQLNGVERSGVQLSYLVERS